MMEGEGKQGVAASPFLQYPFNKVLMNLVNSCHKT